MLCTHNMYTCIDPSHTYCKYPLLSCLYSVYHRHIIYTFLHITIYIFHVYPCIYPLKSKNTLTQSARVYTYYPQYATLTPCTQHSYIYPLYISSPLPVHTGNILYTILHTLYAPLFAIHTHIVHNPCLCCLLYKIYCKQVKQCASLI